MWLSNSSCEEVVVSAWGSGSEIGVEGDILRKVEKRVKELGQWEKDVFGNVKSELSRLRKEIAKEERIAMGDKNTRYFHSCATKRFRKNSMEGIRDEGGVWRTSQEDIGEVMVNYYKSLYTSTDRRVSTGILDFVSTLIDEEMNESLCREFEASEVASALQQMAPLEEPSPDGMPPLFYQHFWSTVNNDVTSPILSWLNSEGLNGLIKKAELQGEIHGYSLCRRGPKLTHLLFADDSFIFCKATMEECDNVLEILKKYEEASGQKMNRSKTSLFFSKAIPEEVKHEIKAALGVPEILHYEKYLGLPSLLGRGKKESFDYIKEKVWRKLQGWEAKLLSQVGREVLIKAVIQAIPTYTMRCFKLLASLCNEIEALIKRFWWGQRGDRRKVHWVKWEEMTKSKTIGGMGFQDLAMFNDSLLAKQAWRLLNNKTSLFYKVFKARFFPNSSLLEAADSRMGSYAWKSILRGRDIIQRGAIWRVGSGEKINIWQQLWLPRKHPTIPLICPLESFENHTVDSLIDPSTRTWNEQLVDGLFVEEDAMLIKKIPFSRNVAEDTLYWPYSTSGNYTCKFGYRFFKEEEELQLNAQTPPICHKHVWKEVWQMQAPPKIKKIFFGEHARMYFQQNMH
ncbi:uncharacterized protein LOC142609107 [Castanea sativa]|uniref:uncharacterized protein LOC142609107 n=1 Tax=Castanea sativa TaxID=21020 RepID=UPI003F65038C